MFPGETILTWASLAPPFTDHVTSGFAILEQSLKNALRPIQV